MTDMGAQADAGPPTGGATDVDAGAGRSTAGKTLEAWAFVRQMLDDMTGMVEADAETELEQVEGLRVLGRAAALCSELSLDVDGESPWFFSMNTDARLIGGPNPDGEYHLAMIDGAHRYRVSGRRGTVCYLGFQVLAGTGLTPRRMAAYVSDTDLELTDGDHYEFVLAAEEPSEAELAGAPWVPIPTDASAIVVRQYIADRAHETLAELAIAPLDPVGVPALPTDDVVAEQFTAMAWTIVKLTTLHRTIRPDLLEQPNQLATSEAADLGAADTTPDNLYMLGTFRLADGEALVIDVVPPDTRYWSVTLENIWHECIDVRRRRSSLTNAHAVPRPASGLGAELGSGLGSGRGSGPDPEASRVRVVVAAADPGVPNWLDTGGRHRGFVTLRWLDNPDAPEVTTRVVPIAEVVA